MTRPFKVVVAHELIAPEPVPQSTPVPETTPVLETRRHCCEPVMPEMAREVVVALFRVAFVAVRPVVEAYEEEATLK